MANTALLDLDGIAISGLSTTASLEDADLVPLYDQSAGDNAAITWANIKTSLNLGNLATLNTVTTSEISSNAVTAAKINNNSIYNNHWVDNAEIIPTGNWDDVITNGFWMGDYTTNNPLGSDNRWWIGQVIAHNQLWVTQELWDFTNSNHNVYRRYRNNGTWLPWKKLTPSSVLHLQHQQASGTNGGTPTLSSWTKYTLNTSVKNDISGASLSSSVITLPAGTYEISAGNWHENLGNGKLRLRNTTDSTTEVLGESVQSPGSGEQARLVLYGEFTLTGTKDLELQYYRTGWTGGSSSLGQAVSQGTEIYGDVRIRKVA